MIRKTRSALAAAAIFLTTSTVGCGDTADAIHDTADFATGNQAVQVGEDLKGQLEEIQQRQLDKR